MCILVVEDDETLGRTFVMQMKNLGYIADLAATAKEAIELFSNRAYELVFMDVGLPDKDGLELTAELRKSVKNGKLPIVGITAGYASREQCVQSGMNEYFVKPLMFDQLREIIKKFDPRVCSE